MEKHERAIMKILGFAVLLFIGVALIAQQPVDVRKISAAATGTQTAANSDSIVCATDTGCISPNGDPCENFANTRTPFNVQSTGTTAIVVVPATSSKKGYICNLAVDTQNSSGDTFAIIDGTQTTNPCDSGTPTGLWGSTTAANGIFVNPGVALGNGAHGLMQTSASNRQICAVFASSTRATVSGIYVVQ